MADVVDDLAGLDLSAAASWYQSTEDAEAPARLTVDDLLASVADADDADPHADAASEPKPEDDGEDTIVWAERQLRKLPVGALYPELIAPCVVALSAWRERLPPKAWRRVWRRERVLKEINECAPVVARALAIVAAAAEGAPPFTFVDLCSGFGFLAMLLSELLPAEKVCRIWLVDKCWPMRNAAGASANQISWEHIYGTEAEPLPSPWPIPLETRKMDLRKAREMRSLPKVCWERGESGGGPVVLLAVHLCGGLSCHAVHLFNREPRIRNLVLKPCCLPGKAAVRKELEWSFSGGHSFSAADLYERSKGAAAFENWAENLAQAVHVSGAGSSKSLEHILVQSKHFQSAYVFVDRGPIQEGDETVSTDAVRRATSRLMPSSSPDALGNLQFDKPRGAAEPKPEPKPEPEL